MSWSFSVRGSTKVAAVSKAVSALLAVTAEQRGHDADSPIVTDAIQGAVAALDDQPAGSGQYVVEGYGSVSGGYEYDTADGKVRAPLTSCEITVKARYERNPPEQA